MNKGIIVPVFFLVIAACVGYGYTRSQAHSLDSITIGFIGPLSGDAAVYGESSRGGMELAVNEINDAGGIDGKRINAVYEDGKCTGESGLSAAQKLIDIDHVNYIVGGGCTSETLAAVPLIDRANVFMISPSASGPQLAGISPLFVRNNPNDNLVGIALADYLSAQYKTFAIISEKTDYAQGLKGVFVREAQREGLSLVSAEDYDPSTTDFRTLLIKVKVAHPEVVFINPQSGANVVRIAQQARQLDIAAPFADANYTGPEVLAGGEVVEGLVSVVAPGLASGDTSAAFLRSYKAMHGAEPAYAFYAGAGYDDIYIIKRGIEHAGDDPTTVAAYIRAIKEYTGTLGTYHFGTDGDLEGIRPVFQKIVGGRLTNL